VVTAAFTPLYTAPVAPMSQRAPQVEDSAVLLVLFDLDGTLFATDDALSGRATLDAIAEVYGVRLPDVAISRVAHPGKTALAITRALLEAAGLDEGEIDAGLGAWCEADCARYLELLAAADTGNWQTIEGAAETLAALSGDRLALLTGVPEPIARARMERLGLAHFFREHEGAFGCEAEERPALIELARRRSGRPGEPWPAQATVAVGDTFADVEGAHAAGIRVVALVSGRATRAELADADAVISRLTDLPAALAGLAG
jgi:phosphoglycolate phosphatase